MRGWPLWLAALAVASCADRGLGERELLLGERHRGPVVLITVTGLRADSVGAFGGAPVTPHLDALISRADWAGRAIAASSETRSANASLLTGLQPWTHGVLGSTQPNLRDELRTLPESLKLAGYRTVAFLSSPWLEEKLGHRQGLDEVRPLGDGRDAGEYLRVLGDEPVFVWVEIRLPTAPYLRHDAVLRSLGERPARLPLRLPARFLERQFDPGVAWRPRLLASARALYLSNVARMDQLLGVVLAGLASSEAKGETASRPLLAVTSSRGEELGEYRQSLAGGSLGRVLIEVPLILDLPSGWSRRIAAQAGERVALTRLAATLIDAVGGEVLPAQQASLLEEHPDGVLSELYLLNGYNELSWYRDGQQLIRRSRFSAPQSDYFAARRSRYAGDGDEIPRQRATEVLRRLRARFAAAPPLSGLSFEERNVLWEEGRESGPRSPPELSEELERAWRRHNGEELPLDLPRLPRADESGLR